MTNSSDTPGLCIHAKSADGYVIRDIVEWREHAPPLRPTQNWKDFRSAKELARAWLRADNPALPIEYAELLAHRDVTSGFRPSLAIAEMEIRIDEFFGPRNSDMVVVGESKGGRVLLAVEAKADEEFADVIGKELEGLSSDSKKPERIERLATAVFKRSVDDHVRSLRYQLLHSLAATAIEAKKHKAKVGVLLIHEFISLSLDFDKVTRNDNDLKAFVQTVPGWRDSKVTTGKLLPLITLHGNAHIPSDQQVTLGKVRTLLPLDATNRERPTPGYDRDSRQYLIC